MRLARSLLPIAAASLALVAAEREAHAGPVSFGAGLIGGFGGNFLDKPGDKTYPFPAPLGRQEPSPSYPGFGGTTSGFGLAFDARVLGLVGLELDLIWMSNRGKADIDITNLNTGAKKSFEVEIGHDALHIPVLLKGSLPLPLFSPTIFIGYEFVRAKDATATITPSDGLITKFEAKTDNYGMLTGGLGFEVKLPLPALDIRIPFSLRAGYNMSTGDKGEDRADYELAGGAISKVTYDTRWKYQALATLGAQIYF